MAVINTMAQKAHHNFSCIAWNPFLEARRNSSLVHPSNPGYSLQFCIPKSGKQFQFDPFSAANLHSGNEDPGRGCACTSFAVYTYRARISGPPWKRKNGQGGHVLGPARPQNFNSNTFPPFQWWTRRRPADACGALNPCTGFRRRALSTDPCDREIPGRPSAPVFLHITIAAKSVWKCFRDDPVVGQNPSRVKSLPNQVASARQARRFLDSSRPCLR